MNAKTRLGLAASTTAIMVVLSLGSVLALPQRINYQGLLVEDGTPVQGTKDLRFRIYDSAEGGTVLWEEPHSVTVTNGVFSVILGSTDPIPKSVFDGSRKWISVSVEDGPEILPRGEIVSVGYAFFAASSDSSAYAQVAEDAQSAARADQAGDADLLDGFDSSQFAGSAHTHDSRYYTQGQLRTSDGSPPNQGSNLVHWNVLSGVPDGFADGTDDVGGGGVSDHGELTGLLDDDHPQYALKDTLKTSDGTPPNQGRNLVHWNILGGVPSAFADGTDNITQDASLITSGTMSPERIQGTAVVDSDPRLLTVTHKNELTGGGTTSLHSHIEVGDISSVTAGEGLSGGGTEGDLTVSHAEDASSLPFAHQYPAIVAYSETPFLESDGITPTIVDTLTIDAPDSGFVYISFSGTQKLYIVGDLPKRYIATYGVTLDESSSIDYSVTASMLDTEFWLGGIYRPTNAVAGSVVRPVAQGPHKVYFLTQLTPIDSGAHSILENASLTAIYFPYDTSTFASLLLGAAAGGR